VQLFNLGNHLQFILLAIKDNEDCWQIWVFFEVAEEVISKVLQIYTLAMKVSQLFHFESTFFGNAVGETLSTK
jgi:hypothetical protein